MLCNVLLCVVITSIFSSNLLTSAALSLLLLVLEQVWPSSCSCSSLFLSRSICSLQWAFCSLRCWFCSSSSFSLFVTQSLIRAALASTCLASASLCCRCKWKFYVASFAISIGVVIIRPWLLYSVFLILLCRVNQPSTNPNLVTMKLFFIISLAK